MQIQIDTGDSRFRKDSKNADCWHNLDTEILSTDLQCRNDCIASRRKVVDIAYGFQKPSNEDCDMKSLCEDFERMRRSRSPEGMQICSRFLCFLWMDIQALIRSIDARDGMVGLRNLCEIEFYKVFEERKITYLKASTVEAAYVDIERVHRNTCLIVTNGLASCTLYLWDSHFHVPTFPA
ncbi:hypothetical protein SUGI_1183750 [Cryptomeria japonica]|nr:hypothetical protein SUGI_1183750 [Cryptomeria japonica]